MLAHAINTWHGYEQAVLARGASLTHRLASRRRGNTTPTGPAATHLPPPSAACATAPAKGSGVNPAGSCSGSDRNMFANSSKSRGGSPISSSGSQGTEIKGRRGLHSTGYRCRLLVPSISSGQQLGVCKGIPGVVNEKEQKIMKIQERGLGERTRRMSFRAGVRASLGYMVDSAFVRDVLMLRHLLKTGRYGMEMET